MATPIDPEKANSLINEYQTQNSASGGSAIKTHTGDFLHGYFLDRESLDEILSNPDVKGVSLSLAKHPDSEGSAENHYTVLYTGAQANTAANPATAYESVGSVYGPPPPCPPECTGGKATV